MGFGPVVYFWWRRALPGFNYAQLLSQNYSRFSNRMKVSNRINLYRVKFEMRNTILNRLSRGFYLGKRLVELHLLFLPVILSSPLLLKEDFRIFWYRITMYSMKRAGPTFIKLGQWASSRPDLIPIDFCRILSELHSNAPYHSMAWNKYMIRLSFDKDIDELFMDFEETPIGSGSVAQVHRAIWRESGLQVAVKILHPNVESKFEIDLNLLGLFARIAHSIPTFSWLHLPEELAYFSQAMYQQLNLKYEGYTLSRFNRNFSSNTKVIFPQPIMASDGVLIETYESGLPISFFTQKSDKRAWMAVRHELAYDGIQSFMQMILWDNFVHADLHPGNMLARFPNCNVRTVEDVCRAYDEGHRPQLVFLDTGLITELSTKDFQNFTDLFKALVFRADGYLAGQLIIERSPENSAAQVINADDFCNELQSIVKPIFSDRAHTLMKLENFSISPLVFRTFDLVRTHHVRLEGAFTNLIMSLVCVEGLGRELTPSLSLKPILVSAGLQYLASNIAKTVVETVDPFI